MMEATCLLFKTQYLLLYEMQNCSWMAAKLKEGARLFPVLSCLLMCCDSTEKATWPFQTIYPGQDGKWHFFKSQLFWFSPKPNLVFWQSKLVSPKPESNLAKQLKLGKVLIYLKAWQLLLISPHVQWSRQLAPSISKQPPAIQELPEQCLHKQCLSKPPTFTHHCELALGRHQLLFAQHHLSNVICLQAAQHSGRWPESNLYQADTSSKNLIFSQCLDCCRLHSRTKMAYFYWFDTLDWARGSDSK